MLNPKKVVEAYKSITAGAAWYEEQRGLHELVLALVKREFDITGITKGGVLQFDSTLVYLDVSGWVVSSKALPHVPVKSSQAKNYQRGVNAAFMYCRQYDFRLKRLMG